MVEAPVSETGCRADRSAPSDCRRRSGLVALPGLPTGSTSGGRSAWRKRVGFCLLLLIAWAIGAGGRKAALLWTRADTSDDEPPRLDSFSQPAVASAILRSEANRLFLAYAQSTALNQSEFASLKVADIIPLPHPGPRPTPRLLSEGAAGGGTLLRPMEQLRQNLGTLETDLDIQLVGAYFNEGLWDQFLDSYIRFMQEAPDNPFVPIWAPAALDIAAVCNRSEELLAALRHVVDFRQKPQSAERLRRTIRDWADAPSRAAPGGNE